MRRGIIAALLVTSAACAGNHPRTAAVATPAPETRNDLHWFRASAEYRGLTREIYRGATDHLDELSRGLAAGSWGVILDADETVLDNSLNERRLADRHEKFSEAEWARWVREGAATEVPGAAAFTDAVHARGGRVVIVTNRPDSLCAPTRANLVKVGVMADMVLCQAGPSDKNPRFESVIHGTAVAGAGPINVVAWVGDNIQDFPGLSQQVREQPDGYREFGVRYFLLPNPIYGSWEKNPEP